MTKKILSQISIERVVMATFIAFAITAMILEYDNRPTEKEIAELKAVKADWLQRYCNEFYRGDDVHACYVYYDERLEVY